MAATALSSSTSTPTSAPISTESRTPKTRPVRELPAALLLGLITVLAALLRLHALTTKSFWFDEALSAGLAGLPWRQFFAALWHGELNMAPYFVLLHLWSNLGTTPGILRGLSVLISVATIPAIYALGVRLFGRSAGMLAAFLLAISAYHIRYAQETRSYALVTLLAITATWLLVRNLQEPSSAHWGLYAVLCTLLLYSHFFAAFLIVAHAISLATLRREKIPFRGLLRSYFWMAVLAIPLAMFVLEVGTAPVNWIPAINLKSPLALGVQFAGNYGVLLLAMNLIALGLALGSWLRVTRERGQTMENWNYGLLFTWLAVPIAALALASLRHPLFEPRYLGYCLPGLILLGAAGINSLRHAAPKWVLTAAIVFCSLLGAKSYYQHDFDVDRDDWPGATSFVFDHAQPGDDVFFLNWEAMPFEYYRSQKSPTPAWPKNLNSPTGVGLTDANYIRPILGELLQQARPAGNRVWLVLISDRDAPGTINRPNAMARAVYGKGRRLVEDRNFGGITVTLFARDPAPAAP